MHGFRQSLALRGLLGLALLAGCTGGTPSRPPVSGTKTRPAPLVFKVDFNTSTIAFFDHDRPHDPRIKLDYTPCLAVGSEWSDAEAAVIDAFKRDRFTAEDLRYFPTLENPGILRIWYEAFSDWHDALVAEAHRRHRGDEMVDALIRITSATGYLVLWSPNGTQTYCFAVQRSGGTVTLLPRLVGMVDF